MGAPATVMAGAPLGAAGDLPVCSRGGHSTGRKGRGATLAAQLDAVSHGFPGKRHGFVSQIARMNGLGLPGRS
jgi:hypothetical protein